MPHVDVPQHSGKPRWRLDVMLNKATLKTETIPDLWDVQGCQQCADTVFHGEQPSGHVHRPPIFSRLSSQCPGRQLNQKRGFLYVRTEDRGCPENTMTHDYLNALATLSVVKKLSIIGLLRSSPPDGQTFCTVQTQVNLRPNGRMMRIVA